MTFWQQGHRLLALGNFFANNLLALAAVVAGAMVARIL
jgi:fluoride ion exporter CrcB/FEX